MKKKKRKLKLLIFIVFIILMLVIILINIDYSKLNHKKYGYEIQGVYRDPKYDLDKDRTAENQLFVSGISIVNERYEGDLKASDVMLELKKIVTNRIPKTYDMIRNYTTDSELEDFYNNNEASLKNMYGIQDFESFEVFAKKIINTNIDYYKYYKLNIIKDTFVTDSDKDGYSYFEYEVEYEDGTKIILGLYFSKYDSLRPNYITR